MLKKTLLIIDDDPRNIFALSANLNVKGFRCLSCSSAAEGLELLEGKESVDAVLMDMMMPGMDGYEAIPKIKKMPKRNGMPVFAVTAQAMAGDMEKCLQAGADGYISKPIDLDKLMMMLSKFKITG